MVSREKNTQIGQDNVGARERGGLTARELTRVVETFNKVLEYKERIRESLEEELGLLAKQTKENLERLKILGRNLEIYEQNMDKIASNLDALDHQEIQVKEKYENLLHGAGSGEGGSLASLNESSDLDESGGSPSLENLIHRREEYLQHLNDNFKKLDDELISIQKYRQELGDAREEISRKQEDAFKKKEILEEGGRKLLEEVSRVEKELEVSIQEERILVDELDKLAESVQERLEISDEIDRVLFSSLTQAEHDPSTRRNGNEPGRDPAG